MHIWDTDGMTLSGADQEIISAEVSYGGAGTCQSATVRPINTSVQGRDTQWQLILSGAGEVFRGIPDSVSAADGQLAQVGLMAPHRPRLDGLGESLAGIAAEETETLSAALQAALGDQPAADIGIRPGGGEVAYVPYGGNDVTAMAYDVRDIGPTYPDAVTDAVFDPGEGWRKYVYKRHPSPYDLRRTAAATADPAIILKEDKATLITRQTSPIPATTDNGVTHSYNNVVEVDNVERTYAEGDSTKTEILSDAGIWTFSVPADTDVRRTKKIRIRCPFFVSKIAPWPPYAPVQFVPIAPGISLTPVGGGTTVIIGTISTNAMPAPPAPLAGTQTVESLTAKVNEQNSYLASVKDQTSAIKSSLDAAKTDLTNLAQRVNALNANTTDSNGNLTNLADELKKTQDKLNALGNSVQKLDVSQRTPRDTPKKGELKFAVSLILVREGVETPLSTAMHVFKEQDIGLELAMQFEIDKDLDKGATFKIRYELVEQDTGRSITMIFRPIVVTADYETPNVEAVKMPDGWDKPYRTPSRREFTLRGWHVPPFTAFGQQIASATVTWNMNECTTRCTTGAMGYG